MCASALQLHASARQHAMIVITVDSHEKALYESMVAQNLEQGLGFEVKFGPLELGDIRIVLSGHDGVLRELVFERKTLADLEGSICDGRYREQKARLLSNVPSSNISYVVEGDTLCQSIRRGAKSVSSAYLNMIFRDDIHLFFTRDVAETGLLLLSICTKMTEKPTNYATGACASTAQPPKDYTSCLKLKSKKNHNITPDNCMVLQLAQIPSISNVIAKNISAVFPSMQALVDAMRACSSQAEKHKILAGINKVGKAKAGKILEYMKL
jgi:ERCC4-type nuclease